MQIDGDYEGRLSGMKRGHILRPVPEPEEDGRGTTTYGPGRSFEHC